VPRTVLVTGASRGLGLAISDRLLREGYRVVGIGRQRSDAYRALVARYPDQGTFHQADLAEIDEIPSLARHVTHTHGPLWGLVNNAGIGNDGVLATMHQSEIDQVIRVNVMAPIVLTKYVSRAMLARREGRIVNVSSIIASTGFSGLSVYGASKAGLEGFTRSLSRELGKRGITVNCVAPGYMETEMTHGLQGQKLERIRRRAPLGLPQPDDAAGAVAYLLGEDGGKVTGRIMTVDGGSTA
jgi:3-oxoacyl-[acyl-carrier protein] reductase